MSSSDDLVSMDEAKWILQETQEPPHDPERDCWTDPAMASMAHTVIAQAEQIKRLQVAVKAILPEYNRLDMEEQRIEEPHEDPVPLSLEDVGLYPADMGE